MRRAHCRGGFTVLRHVLRVLNLISQYNIGKPAHYEHKKLEPVISHHQEKKEELEKCRVSRPWKAPPRAQK